MSQRKAYPDVPREYPTPVLDGHAERMAELLGTVSGPLTISQFADLLGIPRKSVENVIGKKWPGLGQRFEWVGDVRVSGGRANLYRLREA